ncbi:hypothetical protein [Sansalvadorimonas verongulae]|nr:hypothetical protein [Sansalvadorimonas verongulae]
MPGEITGCVLVDSEITGLGERLIAPILITDKGSRPCVSALVGGEIAG